MSDYAEVVETIRDDLVGNIPELFDAKQHLYETWDPEELSAGPGETHLAIWPGAEESESSEPFTNQAHLLNQLYLIQVWQGTGEGARVKRDEAATKDFFDLHNAIRARFYLEANQMLGGSKLWWYRATQFPESIGNARWFRMRAVCQRIQAFS